MHTAMDELTALLSSTSSSTSVNAGPEHVLQAKRAYTMPRGLSVDNRINLIIGTLTIMIAVLSTLLAWATWRLTSDRRHRHTHHGSEYPRPTIISSQD